MATISAKHRFACDYASSHDSRDWSQCAERICRVEQQAMVQPSEARLQEGTRENPWTASQRAAIWTEADLILADPSFNKSRRCVALFRRLIEHALSDEDEGGLKERTLGIEVFGRQADYDTNTDNIVRMTANEIRKRLAQYYQSSSRHHEVYVQLLPGSYLPRFDFGVTGAELPTVPERQAEVVPFRDVVSDFAGLDPPGPASPQTDSLSRRNRTPILVATSLGGCLLGIALTAFFWTGLTSPFRSAQYLLWAPLLKSREPVTICLVDVLPAASPSNDWASKLATIIAESQTPAKPLHTTEMPLSPFVDAEVSARLAGWLKSHDLAFKIARTSTLTLEDFRHGPVVLIGAFDNLWNLALLSKLRYHFQIDPVTKDEWIEDEQNPNKRDWKGSGKLLYSDSSTDFAIITRIMDRDTGSWILAAGGLGLHGTAAAGDFLTDPELSRSLPSAVRSDKQNLQIVLKTTVIDGHTGAPQIIAVYSW